MAIVLLVITSYFGHLGAVYCMGSPPVNDLGPSTYNSDRKMSNFLSTLAHAGAFHSGDRKNLIGPLFSGAIKFIPGHLPHFLVCYSDNSEAISVIIFIISYSNNALLSYRHFLKLQVGELMHNH